MIPLPINLDLPTAALLAGATGTIVALLILLVSRTQSVATIPSQRLLALGMAGYGVAFFLIAFSDALASWASAVIGNGLLVLSFVSFSVVLRRMLGLRTRSVVVCGLVIAVFCMGQNAWFLAHGGAVNQRLLIGSLCQLAVTALIVVVPWQVSRKQHSLGLWLVVFAFVVFGLFVLQRILLFAFARPMATIFGHPGMQSLAYMDAALLPVVAGVGFVQMYSHWAQAEHWRLASIDPLTGCLNRRAIEEQALERIELARRSKHSLALLVLDLDELKAINDSRGHAAGDMALTRFGALLRACIHERDLCGRIGGDEFLVLLEDADAASAQAFAQDLRGRLQEESGPDWPLAASIGVAVFTHGEDDMTAMLKRADDAMYQDKRDGRET